MTPETRKERDSLFASVLTEQRRANRGRPSKSKRRLRTFLLITVCILLPMVSTVLLSYNYTWRLPAAIGNSNHRAALIDELSVQYSDPVFLNNATKSLEGAGYAVDYYAPDKFTVGLFRDLPTKGYGIIIVRAHTAGQSIVTTEPYSQSAYLYEQLTDRLAKAYVQNSPPDFAVTAQFMRHEMRGQLPDSLVIIMGCSGLAVNHELASAFLDKGARTVVGWDGFVSATYTDIATARVLESFSAGRPLPEAVGTVAQPDPLYRGRLTYLDWSSVASQRLHSLITGLTVWSSFIAILIFGPLTVFLGPKLLSRQWIRRGK
jgi:nitrate reductase NapE component